MRKTQKATSAALAVAACLAAAAIYASSVSADDQERIRRAVFSADGSVQAPTDYINWVHVGTVVEPDELNPGGKAAFPEFHSVYLEPSAFEHFVETGTWPEGAQFVKERTLVREGDNCDKKTGACVEASGTGYFQGEYKGLELAVKDSKRFRKEPGGWAYFSFGNEGKPYSKSAKAFPTAECNVCHQAAAQNDFVFTQFYPILREHEKRQPKTR